MDRFSDEWEALIAADALDDLFERLDCAITAPGHLPLGGQIDTDSDRLVHGWLPSGGCFTDPPWHNAMPFAGPSTPSLAENGSLRCQIVTDAARHDGGQLREGLIARTNTSRSLCAGEPCGRHGPRPMANAYHSAENEDWLEARVMTGRIHREKPRGRPMPKRTRHANAAKSAVRSKVERVFAQQKARMGMIVRTIGLARARAAITLASMASDMARWRWLDSRPAPA